MPYLRFILLPISLVACGPGGSDTADASTGTNPATSTDASTGDPPTSGPTTDNADTTSSAASTGDPPTSGSTTGQSTAVTTGDESSTGEPAFCQGWQGADGAPFLTLHDRLGAELANGSTLPLECGGQGLFMFGLYPTFGGFVPPGDNLDFQVVVDVDGFNENPEGHFYSADPVGYYVSCEQVVGGVLGVLPVFPFDNLEDLTALDGKPAQVHVLMKIGDEPVAVDLEVVLSVAKDDSWAFCGG